jgi:hypothetical protein
LRLDVDVSYQAVSYDLVHPRLHRLVRAGLRDRVVVVEGGAVIHLCPPFTDLPSAAPCGARQVLMTMDPRRVTCAACKVPKRRRGQKKNLTLCTKENG